MEDEKIVELFWARDEDAIKKTELRVTRIFSLCARIFVIFTRAMTVPVPTTSAAIR